MSASQKPHINQTLAFILGGGKGTRLYPLTKDRSKPAVPFGGNYRLIDIPISNCINSGVNRVFVMTQFQSASLNRHTIQTYKFDIFHNAFVDILASELTSDNNMGGFAEGTADAVRKGLKHLRSFLNVKYILILSGDQLYRMDFNSMFDQHVETNADVTLGVLPIPERDASRFGILKLDADNRINTFLEKPKSLDLINGWEVPSERQGEGKFYNGSMGIYLFSFDVLYDFLMSNTEMLDFGKEVIPHFIKNMNVFGCTHDDYWEDIGTIRSFHEANLTLVEEKPIFNFYDPRYPFFCKPRFLPPSRVTNSSIDRAYTCDGAVIDECKITKCIIGPRTIIEKGTIVENSIITGSERYETDEEMAENKANNIPHLGVGSNCVIKNAIIDRDCRVGNNVQIINKNNVQETVHEEMYSIVDGIVVIPKKAIIPDGTII